MVFFPQAIPPPAGSSSVTQVAQKTPADIIRDTIGSATQVSTPRLLSESYSPVVVVNRDTATSRVPITGSIIGTGFPVVSAGQTIFRASATSSVTNGVFLTRTTTTGSTAFLTGWYISANTATVMSFILSIGGTEVFRTVVETANRAEPTMVIFPTPLVATSGQAIEVTESSANSKNAMIVGYEVVT